MSSREHLRRRAAARPLPITELAPADDANARPTPRAHHPRALRHLPKTGPRPRAHSPCTPRACLLPLRRALRDETRPRRAIASARRPPRKKTHLALLEEGRGQELRKEGLADARRPGEVHPQRRRAARGARRLVLPLRGPQHVPEPRAALLLVRVSCAPPACRATPPCGTGWCCRAHPPPRRGKPLDRRRDSSRAGRPCTRFAAAGGGGGRRRRRRRGGGTTRTARALG